MLKFRLRTSSQLPIETPGLTADVCRGASLREMERREAWHGKERACWGELFQISGSADDGLVELSEAEPGGLRGVHYVGAEQESGTLVIAAHCGRHAASQMKGGVVRVEGSAGHWAGAEMRGGELHIAGDAGDFVGSAYRGSTLGMRGGAILVHGNAGAEVGHSMRRGLIAIAGVSGDFAGVDLAAGTILAAGGFGRRAGAGMRRGTLVSFGSQPPELLPTFIPGADGDPLVLRLLLRELERLNLRLEPGLEGNRGHAPTNYSVWHGDRLCGGRGELFWRKPAAN